MQISGVKSMIDVHTTNESFKGMFYSKFLLNLKERSAVESMIDEHTIK
jgi:hypothetical protein